MSFVLSQQLNRTRKLATKLSLTLPRLQQTNGQLGAVALCMHVSLACSVAFLDQ
jgi:hypothetical protein